MPRRTRVPPELSIVYVPLAEIMRWPANPKNHDLGAIAASIEAFGFRDPVGVNQRTHEIEEGHGRIDTLRAFQAQGRRAPEFILVDDRGRDWLVPVLFFDDDARTQHAYGLAHNRTQELGGGYDDGKLLAALQEQADGPLLDAAGFDVDDLDALRAKLDDPDPRAHPDSLNILVTCQSQDQRSDLMERLAAEGFTCREV